MTRSSRSLTADLTDAALPGGRGGLSREDQKGEDMNRKHWTMIVPGAVLLCATPAFAVDLREAVQSALNTNPEIRQAVHNKIATREERKQAQGRWLPTISVEGSAGIRSLRNPTRRAIGIAGDRLEPVGGQVIADQLLFDFGERTAEIRRQASRATPPAPGSRSAAEFVAAEHQPRLYRLSAATAAGCDRGGQCDVP